MIGAGEKPPNHGRGIGRRDLDAGQPGPGEPVGAAVRCPVHAFDVLGDPVRRRILELLGDGELTSGALCEVIRGEFGITQPAVSQHLEVLRDNGFATARPEGARRLYAVVHEPLRDIDAWLEQFRRFWTPHLEALATELARARHDQRSHDRCFRGDQRGPPRGGRPVPARGQRGRDHHPLRAAAGLRRDLGDGQRCELDRAAAGR